MATDSGSYYPFGKIYYSQAVDPGSFYIYGQNAIWKAEELNVETDPLRAAIDAAVGELRR